VGVARRDRARYGRRVGHQRHHAANRQVEAVRLAVAGALYRCGRARPAARQNATLAHCAAFSREEAGHHRKDGNRKTGQCYALERKMAKAVGVSYRSVQRVWAGAGLKPHLVRTFKVSNDPNFAAKVVDIVGLYMNPPERALVLCVDEKSQIQALDRTQPGLPMKKGRAATMTHDYKRNGTTTLFAALDTKSGKVIGECLPRHRAKEFIRFLNKIDTAVDKALDLHLILDNYSTHKTKRVQNWLKRHKRFNLHFIPTSSSWLNLVERFFALITENAIRRGVFNSVDELEATIADYLANHNAEPKPFVWTKSADVILAKVDRARATLAAVKAGNQPLESVH
jgi:transposase